MSRLVSIYELLDPSGESKASQVPFQQNNQLQQQPHPSSSQNIHRGISQAGPGPGLQHYPQTQTQTPAHVHHSVPLEPGLSQRQWNATTVERSNNNNNNNSSSSRSQLNYHQPMADYTDSYYPAAPAPSGPTSGPTSAPAPAPATHTSAKPSIDLSQYHLKSEDPYMNTSQHHQHPQAQAQVHAQVQHPHLNGYSAGSSLNQPGPYTVYGSTEIPNIPGKSLPKSMTVVDTNNKARSGSGLQKAKKRKRVPVSCNTCRHRKIKCDRQRPCSSCISLSLSHSCKYESQESTNQDIPSSWKSSNEGKLEAYLFQTWKQSLNIQSIMFNSPLGSQSYSSAWRRLTDYNKFNLTPKLLELLTDPQERKELEDAQPKLTALFKIDLESFVEDKNVSSGPQNGDSTTCANPHNSGSVSTNGATTPAPTLASTPTPNATPSKKPKFAKDHCTIKYKVGCPDITENGASLAFLAESISSDEDNEDKARTILNLLKNTPCHPEPIAFDANATATQSEKVGSTSPNPEDKNANGSSGANASPRSTSGSTTNTGATTTTPSSSSNSHTPNLGNNFSNWWIIFGWFPPRSLCELLCERYLKTVNMWFHSLTKDIASEIMDDVFALIDLYKEGRTGEHELSKTELHKAGVLYSILSISLNVTPLDWTEKFDGAELDHQFYLGRNIRCLAMGIVNITDPNKECNMWYSMLTLLILIYSTVVSGEMLDVSRNSPWGTIVTYFFKSCSNIDMHRDPKSIGLDLPEHHVYMRKILWRMAVYFDTVFSLELVKPVFFCLKYAESELLTDMPPESYMNSLSPDMKEVELAVYKTEQKLMEWCMLTRDVLHDVILVPDTKQERSVVLKYQQAVDKFYEDNVVIRDEQDLFENSDGGGEEEEEAAAAASASKPLSFRQEAQYTLEYILHHKTMGLKTMILNFAKTTLYNEDCGDDSSSDSNKQAKEKQLLSEIFPDSKSVKIAFEAMQFEYFYVRQTDRLTSMKHYMASLSVRTGIPFWLIAVGYLAMKGFLPKISAKLYDDEDLDSRAILRLVFRSYRSVCALAKYKYFAWKIHLLLTAVLINFQKLIFEKETETELEKQASGKSPEPVRSSRYAECRAIWKDQMKTWPHPVPPRYMLWKEKVLQDFGLTEYY